MNYAIFKTLSPEHPNYDPKMVNTLVMGFIQAKTYQEARERFEKYEANPKAQKEMKLGANYEISTMAELQADMAILSQKLIAWKYFYQKQLNINY